MSADRLLFTLVGLASFALPTFAQQTNTPDPKLRQVAEAQGAKFSETMNNNDAAARAALYTEDAVVVDAEKGPINGRKAIEHFAELFQKVRFSNHIGTADPHLGRRFIWQRIMSRGISAMRIRHLALPSIKWSC
ncbi:MAG TPA: ketosteroid isomerase family protein [Terrimicrobiaceae bacterium]